MAISVGNIIFVWVESQAYHCKTLTSFFGGELQIKQKQNYKERIYCNYTLTLKCIYGFFKYKKYLDKSLLTKF